MSKGTMGIRPFSTRVGLILALFASVIAGVPTLSASPSAAQPEDCTYTEGSADCNGWSFDYFLAGGSVSPTGLTLTDVEYEGKSVLSQTNFAGLPVEYLNNACGPYIDLFSTLTNSQPTGVQAATFDQGGSSWLELGVNYQIGSYVLYTAFYFGDSGEMKMRIFARGLQCSVNHEHYPIYVMDIDLEGNDPSLSNHGIGDEVYYKSGDNWIEQTNEADNPVSDFGDNWIVRDPDSAMTVLVNHDLGSFEPPVGDVFPAQGGVENIVYTRQAGPLSEYAWPGASTTGGQYYLGGSYYNDGQWGYNDEETLDDPVIVVRGILDHQVAPGLPDDWHTAGISLKVIDDPLDIPPPSGPIEVDESCTLVQAIYSANTDSTVDGSECEPGDGEDTIQVPAGQFEFGILDGEWGVLPTVTESVEILGEGPNATTLATLLSSQGGVDRNLRLFTLGAGVTLTLEGMTLQGPSVDVNPEAPFDDLPGPTWGRFDRLARRSG